MFKKSSLIVIFIAANFLSGCATMFGDKNRSITIDSNPSGANVEYAGQDFGTTPTQIIVRNTFNPDFVTVSKAHYKTVNRQVQTSFQGVGFLNLLFWPGFIIDAATGNMMAVDQHRMNFVLRTE